MTERDQEEQDLRIDQMTINIEKLRNDIRYGNRKFLVQLLAALALTIGVSVSATTYVTLYLLPHYISIAPAASVPVPAHP